MLPLTATTVALLEASGLTLSNIQSTLSLALNDALGPDQWGYLQDVIGDETSGEIVYSLGGKLWKCGYAIDAGKSRAVTLQTSRAVQVLPRMSYDKAGPTSIEAERKELCESAELCGELADLRESADASYTIKVIQAGQGSSAYYPKKVLMEQGPRVFRSGTKMYWNHPTRKEESDRPEGDLSYLAGVLTGNAYWDEAGKKGPGLYAPVKVFSDFAEQVSSKAPHIGVSIRAYGTGATKDGVYTIENLSHAESIDFVTEPGAGGRVLTESRIPGQTNEKESDMDKAEFQKLFDESAKPLQAQVALLTEANVKLTEANATLAADNATLKTKNVTSEARTYIANKVRAEKLPDGAKLRAVEAVLARTIPVTAAGALDTAALDTMLTEAVKAEADYIASITESGRVRGMGSSAPPEELTDEVYAKRMTEAAKSLGFGEADAAVWGAGRQ